MSVLIVCVIWSYCKRRAELFWQLKSCWTAFLLVLVVFLDCKQILFFGSCVEDDEAQHLVERGLGKNGYFKKNPGWSYESRKGIVLLVHLHRHRNYSNSYPPETRLDQLLGLPRETLDRVLVCCISSNLTQEYQLMVAVHHLGPGHQPRRACGKRRHIRETAWPSGSLYPVTIQKSNNYNSFIANHSDHTPGSAWIKPSGSGTPTRCNQTEQKWPWPSLPPPTPPVPRWSWNLVNAQRRCSLK